MLRSWSTTKDFLLSQRRAQSNRHGQWGTDSGTPEKGGAGGLPPLLPFDRRGKRGQNAPLIKVPSKPANCNNQRDSYETLIAVLYS